MSNQPGPIESALKALHVDDVVEAAILRAVCKHMTRPAEVIVEKLDTILQGRQMLGTVEQAQAELAAGATLH
ncbi:hypothetical protein D3C85_1784610 [compost metagenome]